MTQIVKDNAVTKWLPREYQLVPKLATHEGHPPAHARTTYGAYATHLFTFLGEDATRYWVPAPLEAWLLAGALYIVGVAISRTTATGAIKTLLGFDSHAMAQDVPTDRIIDIASTGPARARPRAASPARAPSSRGAPR